MTNYKISYDMKLKDFRDLMKEDEFVTNISDLRGELKRVWGDKFRSKRYDAEDYTKCIRDMNSIKGNSSGVVFPMKEKSIKGKFGEKPDEEIYSDYYIKHKISKYNSYDNFYAFPILVPTTSNYKNYKEWNKKFRENLHRGINKIEEKYIYEKDKRDRLKNILEKLESLNLKEEDKEFFRKYIGM